MKILGVFIPSIFLIDLLWLQVQFYLKKIIFVSDNVFLDVSRNCYTFLPSMRTSLPHKLFKKFKFFTFL